MSESIRGGDRVDQSWRKNGSAWVNPELKERESLGEPRAQRKGELG